MSEKRRHTICAEQSVPGPGLKTTGVDYTSEGLVHTAGLLLTVTGKADRLHIMQPSTVQSVPQCTVERVWKSISNSGASFESISYSFIKDSHWCLIPNVHTSILNSMDISTCQYY